MNVNINRLSHAYITTAAFADTLAMAAVCSGEAADRPCLICAHCDKASRGLHPDVITVDFLKDKREILVDQIRELKKDVIVVPNEASKKAYVINHADTMNGSAQNAFLRILEEPPSHTVFVLGADNPALLLPTVRSRCVELKARDDTMRGTTPPAAVDDIARLTSELMAAINGGNVRLLEFMFRLDKLKKEQLAEFLPAARELVVRELRMSICGESDRAEVAGGVEVFVETDATNGVAGTDYPDRTDSAYGIIRNNDPDRIDTGWITRLELTERLLVRAGEMLSLNVNAGHIAGHLCASLIL
jgi:DNA polymerase-3 subunit delta'